MMKGSELLFEIAICSKKGLFEIVRVDCTFTTRPGVGGGI